jgi:coenzyme F420-reducing hydrogenase alpha subunit
MTHSRDVRPLSRVEGLGGVRIRIVDGQAELAEFAIYEPPRFFARLLRGRAVREVPDIVARICGICPVAYQLTACGALEKALGLDVGADIRRLRRLLACGEWIQSHALHVHLLHAPDFLNCESCFSFPAEYVGLLDRGLRLKALGSRIIEVLGGRAVHPVNVAVGGFHRAPSAAEVRGLTTELDWGLHAALDTLATVSRFDFPAFEQTYEHVSLRAATGYPLEDGRIIASRRGQTTLDIPVEEHDRHFRETVLPSSSAPASVLLPDDRPSLSGPLARITHCLDQLPPRSRRAADQCGIAWPSANMHHSIAARAIEIAAACEEGLAIAQGCRADLATARVDYEPQPAEACHATEAPRGLLYHRYRIDADGLIADAAIVPPTGRNQPQIGRDLQSLLPGLATSDDATITAACERLIRSYDPCISCAAHFLDVRIEGRNRPPPTRS